MSFYLFAPLKTERSRGIPFIKDIAGVVFLNPSHIHCSPYLHKFSLHLIFQPVLSSPLEHLWVGNSTRLCLLGNQLLAKFLVGDDQGLTWIFKPKLWECSDLINNLLAYQSSLPKGTSEFRIRRIRSLMVEWWRWGKIILFLGKISGNSLSTSSTKETFIFKENQQQHCLLRKSV